MGAQEAFLLFYATASLSMDNDHFLSAWKPKTLRLVVSKVECEKGIQNHCDLGNAMVLYRCFCEVKLGGRNGDPGWCSLISL